MTKYSSPTPSDASIGQKLYELRRSRKLSQSQIGEILGVSYQQVQKYEKGLRRISTENIQLLSSRLNVPVLYFFTQTQDPVKAVTQDMLEELILTYFKIHDSKQRADLLNYAKSLVLNQIPHH